MLSFQSNDDGHNGHRYPATQFAFSAALRDRMTTQTAPWITYRPELKVLDCTIRDGGLINNHQFS